MPLSANVADQLKAALGPSGWTDDRRLIEPLLLDQRGRFRGEASLLLLPDTMQRVADVVRICAASGTPIVPQGGNTGLVGGATPAPDGTAVLLNLRRMNRIRQIDAGSGCVSVEAGCVLAEVQRAAREAGFLFPLSMGSEGTCQIGGNLATNAGGMHVVRYGNMRALTLGVEAVLPNGEVFHGLRPLLKDNTGYDLKHWLIGAEGTLGVITAATLRLFPIPTHAVTAIAAFDTFEAVAMFAAELRALTGDMLSECEVMSCRCIEVVEKHAPVRPPFAAPPPWSLLFTVSGFTAGANVVVERLLEQALASGAATDAAIADSGARESELWRLRELISPAQRKEGAVLAHDISVPIGRLAEFMRNAAAIVEELVPKAQICAFGHIGDGNIHYNLPPAVDSDGSTFKEASALLSGKLHDLAGQVGGSFSAEHGVGQLRKQELLRYRGGVEVEMMRTVKRALDPQGIMNPGKIL